MIVNISRRKIAPTEDLRSSLGGACSGRTAYYHRYTTEYSSVSSKSTYIIEERSKLVKIDRNWTIIDSVRQYDEGLKNII